MICGHFKRYQTCTNDRRFPISHILETAHRMIVRNSKTTWDDWVLHLEFEHHLARDLILDLTAKQAALKTETHNLVRAIAEGLERSKTMAWQILENEAELDELAANRRRMERLPDPASLDFEAFRARAAAAADVNQKKSFLETYLTQVVCDHTADGQLALVRLVPNFEAMSGINKDRD